MIASALLFPLAVAALLVGPRSLRRVSAALFPCAALPALAASVAAPIPARKFDWLVIGLQFGIDDIGRTFLFFTAVLWTAAGLGAYATVANDPHGARYGVFHLSALAGNLILIAAADAVSFYGGFALMTFAAYGLVVHDEAGAARRAGTAYLVMAVLGEGALLAGLLLGGAADPSGAALPLADFAAATAASPHREMVGGLLLVGFGVKAGLVPLHMWLPLAHPVAPTPASAVLSGCMIKAGVLGWLRFLPLGVVAQTDLGMALMVLGICGMVLGIVAGLAQSDAKTVLAYSSISQMGFMAVAVGAAWHAPQVAPAALTACAAYAVHHGLTKGALFLGTGVAAMSEAGGARRMVLLSLLLPALSLAGVAWTSGFAAKEQLVPFGGAVPALPLGAIFAAVACGTTLLMARFLVLVARYPLAAAGRAPARLDWLAYVVALAAACAAGWSEHFPGTGATVAAPGAVEAGLSVVPVLLGALVAWGAMKVGVGIRLAPGDLIEVVERPAVWLHQWATAARLPSSAGAMKPLAVRWHGIYSASRPTDRLLRMEIELTRWEVAALLVVVLAAALFAVTLVTATWGSGA